MIEGCNSCAIVGICQKAIADDVTISSKDRWIAIVVAFVVPLLLLVGSVLLGRLPAVSETVSAIIALGAVAVYYLALAIGYRIKDKKLQKI